MNRSCYSLIFVLSSPTKARSLNFGADFSAGYMGFYPPGALIESVLPEGYANATLTIPVEFFQASLERHFPEIPEEVLRSGAGMRIGQEEQTLLLRILSNLEHLMWYSPELLACPIRLRQIEDELLSAFLSGLRSGCANVVPQPSNLFCGRYRRLRQAHDFFLDHLHEPIYLDDLCAELNLTRRGVENLFRDLLGIAPLTYFRRKRLNEVRHTLLQSEPGSGAVKFAARGWGFLHQGHFAREYRSLFGESPSQTLSLHTR
jgi:AraC-like DNA-binding protein